MVGMMICGVRDKNLRRAKVQADSSQVAQDFLTKISGTRAKCVAIWNFRGIGQAAMERSAVVPVTGPDRKRPEVGITQKYQVVCPDAKDLSSRDRFIMPKQGKSPNR